VDPFVELLRALKATEARFLVIGVWGANYYAHAGSVVFETRDRDLFLPPDPANLVKAWDACVAARFSLWAGEEPLDQPRDLWLAERVVERRALVRAIDQGGLEVDLSLVMAGFEFETIWKERRLFQVEGVEVPVARLSQIVASKAAAGRQKDRLFLATHEEALRQLLGKVDF
jgi:hypothetical protein